MRRYNHLSNRFEYFFLLLSLLRKLSQKNNKAKKIEKDKKNDPRYVIMTAINSGMLVVDQQPMIYQLFFGEELRRWGADHL